MNDLYFTPDGRSLIAPGPSGSVVEWNVGNWSKEVAYVTATGQAIRSLVLSQDGSKLAVASSEIELVQMKTKRLECKLTSNNESIKGMAISPNNKWLATRTNDTVSLISIEDGRVERRWTLDSDDELQHWDKLPLAFSANGKRVIAGLESGSIMEWDCDSSNPARELLGHSESIVGLAYTQDGAIRASVDQSGRVVVRDEVHQKVIGDYWVPVPRIPHHLSAMCLSFSHNAKYLALGCDQPAVHVWSLETSSLLNGSGHSSVVLSVRPFANDRVISASQEGAICTWNLTSGKELQRLVLRGDQIRDLFLITLGSRYAVALTSKALTVLSLDPLKEQPRLSVALPFSGTVGAARQSEAAIAVANERGEVTLFHIGGKESARVIASGTAGRAMWIQFAAKGDSVLVGRPNGMTLHKTDGSDLPGQSIQGAWPASPLEGDLVLGVVLGRILCANETSSAQAPYTLARNVQASMFMMGAKYLLCNIASEESWSLLEVASGNEVQRWRSDGRRIVTANASHCGQFVYVGCEDSSIHILAIAQTANVENQSIKDNIECIARGGNEKAVYQSMWTLVGSGDLAIQELEKWFRAREVVRPSGGMRSWVKSLEDDRIEVREGAVRQLKEYGARAESFLVSSLETEKSEKRLRVEGVLFSYRVPFDISAWDLADQRLVTVVEMVHSRRSMELLGYLAGNASSSRTRRSAIAAAKSH